MTENITVFEPQVRRKRVSSFSRIPYPERSQSAFLPKRIDFPCINDEKSQETTIQGLSNSRSVSNATFSNFGRMNGIKKNNYRSCGVNKQQVSKHINGKMNDSNKLRRIIPKLIGPSDSTYDKIKDNGNHEPIESNKKNSKLEQESREIVKNNVVFGNNMIDLSSWYQNMIKEYRKRFEWNRHITPILIDYPVIDINEVAMVGDNNNNNNNNDNNGSKNIQNYNNNDNNYNNRVSSVSDAGSIKNNGNKIEKSDSGSDGIVVPVVSDSESQEWQVGSRKGTTSKPLLSPIHEVSGEVSIGTSNSTFVNDSNNRGEKRKKRRIVPQLVGDVSPSSLQRKEELNEYFNNNNSDSSIRQYSQQWESNALDKFKFKNNNNGINYNQNGTSSYGYLPHPDSIASPPKSQSQSQLQSQLLQNASLVHRAQLPNPPTNSSIIGENVVVSQAPRLRNSNINDHANIVYVMEEDSMPVDIYTAYREREREREREKVNNDSQPRYKISRKRKTIDNSDIDNGVNQDGKDMEDVEPRPLKRRRINKTNASNNSNTNINDNASKRLERECLEKDKENSEDDSGCSICSAPDLRLNLNYRRKMINIESKQIPKSTIKKNKNKNKNTNDKTKNKIKLQKQWQVILTPVKKSHGKASGKNTPTTTTNKKTTSKLIDRVHENSTKKKKNKTKKTNSKTKKKKKKRQAKIKIKRTNSNSSSNSNSTSCASIDCNNRNENKIDNENGNGNGNGKARDGLEIINLELTRHGNNLSDNENSPQTNVSNDDDIGNAVSNQIENDKENVIPTVKPTKKITHYFTILNRNKKV